MFILISVYRKDAEFQKDLKALPERRRRTFLRYLENLEKGNWKINSLAWTFYWAKKFESEQ